VIIIVVVVAAVCFIPGQAWIELYQRSRFRIGGKEESKRIESASQSYAPACCSICLLLDLFVKMSARIFNLDCCLLLK
jgi:hypothetical protein